MADVASKRQGHNELYRQRVRAGLILVAPLILFTALFIVYPLFSGIITAFQDNTLLSPEKSLNGIKNFTRLFSKTGFLESVRFTLMFAVTVVAIEMVLGFGLALLVNQKFPGKKALFTLLLLPIMIAPALIGIMFRLLLNDSIGAVPAILKYLGISISLFSPDSVIPLLVVLDVLQWTPFTFLIIYAGLQSFPQETLEAAAVDGAGYWQATLNIVVPVLKPVLFAALFLRAIDAIRTFDVIYVLTAGGPGTKTTTASIFIYKAAFESGDFGQAAAASLLLVLALLPFVPWIVKRIASTGEEMS